MFLVIDEQIIHDFILKINIKIFILHFIILGLLEELKNGNFNTYLLLIVTILIFHLYWSRDIKEPMSAVSNDLKEAIKKVYLADVEAIRNLSEVATKLQSGGLSVPGNLTTSGNTTVNGSKLITSNNNTIECGGRQHMSGPELLYILHKNGVVIGKEWGGNGNLQVQGSLVASGRDILGELNALRADINALRSEFNATRGEFNTLKSQAVKYNDFINITTTGTGNHEGHGKYIGFCGHGACGMVNAGITNDKGRGILRIEKN
jgi:hypothetical protein